MPRRLPPSISKELRKRLDRRREEFNRILVEWGSKNSSNFPWRSLSDPYCILIAELLLRKTRAENVTKVYCRFIQEFPTITDLAHAPLKNIQEVVLSLGLASRAKKLKDVAVQLEKNFGSSIPSEPDKLFSVLGSGSRYTVNAFLCFGLGKKVPVFDVNTARVIGRVFSITFGKEAHKSRISWDIADYLLPPADIREYNIALLDIGRTICRPEPLCYTCPLLDICDCGQARKRISDSQPALKD